MGQVREGTGVDLAVCPVGLAQKDATMCALARRRLGQDFCHIHDDYQYLRQLDRVDCMVHPP